MAQIVFRMKRNIGANQMKYAVGNDCLRPVMQGVCFNPSASELACTDAHVLVMYPIEILSSDYKEAETFILPVYIFDQKHYYNYNLNKFFPMTRFVFKVDTEKERIYVYSPLAANEEGFNLTEESLLFSVPLIEGKYPNYHAVLPKEPFAIEKIGLNLWFVDRLTKATKEPGSSASLHRFKATFDATLHGSNRAIMFYELNEDPVKALIMPVMLNE